MKEKVIDSWAVGYISQNGEKYKGQLTITSNRLMYDLNSADTPKVNCDVGLFVQLGSDDYVVIRKEAINTIIITKRLLEKRVMIKMNNQDEHIFECGKFNIDSITRALSDL